MSGRWVDTTRIGHPRIWIATVLLLQAVAVGRCADPSSDQSQTARLNPELSLDQYEYRVWTMQDGLPSDQVVDILQTRDGYLWLATENGLARFDGVKFTNFNRSNTPVFATNRITVLHEGRDGTLWIGTRRGGLIRCRPGQPPAFRRFAELEGFDIQCLCEDRGGTLWIGTEVATWTVTDGKCNLRRDAPLNVRALVEDESGKLWLGTSIWGISRPDFVTSSDVEQRPGLYRLDDGQFYRLTETDGFPETESEGSVTALCTDPDGGLWIGTNREPLLRYRDDKFEDHGVAVGLQARHSVAIHQDRGGCLWVSARTGGLQRVAGGNTKKMPANERLNLVRCLAEDRDGNIWFGGSNRGLHRISNPEIAMIRLDVPNAPMRCVLEDTAGDVWFGSGSPAAKNNRKVGLHRMRSGMFEHFGKDHGLPTNLVTGLAEGPDGRLWIGTHEGLACRANDESITTFTMKDGMGRNWIRAVYADRAGVVWIGFWEGGLQRMDQNTFTTIADFGDADVNWFHEDAGGVLWIGSNRGLYQWLDDRLERVSDVVLDRLPTINFSCCFEDQQGHLWLGTEGGGLCRYADGEFSNWTSEHGLNEDAIYAIQQDARGRLWLGGSHGLTSLAKHSLDALISGAINHLDIRIHDMRAGEDRRRIRPDYRPNVLRRDDGSLWIVTTRGTVVVPPDGPYQHPLPPLVHIEDVRVNGESRGVNTSLEIISGSRHIDFHFTANTFAAPERARFRYRLDGYDDGWIDAGIQRSASYTDVRPGQYVFRVTADNGYDVWNEQDAVMALTVNPRWWEIKWLRVAALLASIAAVIGYFRHRMRKVRKANIALRHQIADRQRAEEESRINLEQLARVSRAASLGELTTSIAHEVKQPLFAIVSNAQTARRLLDRPQPDLHEIGDALNDIVGDGNRAADIIDRVRSLLKKEHQPSEQLNLDIVAREAIRFAEPEIHRRGLTIGTEFASDLPPIRGDAVELQQVVLNLLINGAQAMSDLPSDSRTLTVRTSASDGSVELAVQDHGVGVTDEQTDRLFEPFYTTKPDGTGMGLAINRTIIEAHGGNIWATPNANCGMTFHVRLPAAGEIVS